MDIKKEAIQPEKVWNSRVFGFTHAVKKGNILTISGQNGINIKGEVEGKGDFEKQTSTCLRKYEKYSRLKRE